MKKFIFVEILAPSTIKNVVIKYRAAFQLKSLLIQSISRRAAGCLLPPLNHVATGYRQRRTHQDCVFAHTYVHSS